MDDFKYKLCLKELETLHTRKELVNFALYNADYIFNKKSINYLNLMGLIKSRLIVEFNCRDDELFYKLVLGVNSRVKIG